MVLDLVEAILDTLRDLDLALAGQQFDRTHFAHVHAHGVRRAAKLGIDTRQGGFGLFGCVVIVGDRAIGQQYRLGVRRFLVHRNAHVVDHVDDVFDLLGIDDVVRQVIVDLGT